MEIWSIAILGGGPGGLMTAYRLQKRLNRPCEITIYEASGRLGGKILTPRFSGVPAAYEAGAAELYDYSGVGPDPLRELIAELGLTTQPMEGCTVVMDGQILTTDEQIEAHLGPAGWDALNEFDDRAQQWMTPKEFYDADWKEADPDPMALTSFHSLLADVPDARARRYIETLVHSDLATEPRRTNAFYGLQNYLMNDAPYMRLYTIDGGIERLPQELARRIESTVRLEEPVVRVERGEGDLLRVISRHAGGVRIEEFDFVVAALPNNWLLGIGWGGELLAGAMERHHAHYDHPAHYLRVSLLFRTPFWRAHIAESFFMLDAFGGCCVYDESSRNGDGDHGVLGWLLGGEPALTLSNLPDAELIPMMLASLPESLRNGSEHIAEGRVHRWCGSVNGLPGGVPAQKMEARHQPEPLEHPNLFVVGDYLMDSTINGVLDSADFVAEWIVEEMEDDAP